MREVSEEVVGQIIGKIYRDSLVKQTKGYFITPVYLAKQFETFVDAEAFHRIIGFLPNTKYRGVPFIMGVSFNKMSKEYEVTVHNPKVKF